MHRRRLELDDELQTSLRWLTTNKGPMNSMSRKICISLGLMKPDEQFNPKETKTKAIFILSQLVYTVVTMLPCKVKRGWKMRRVNAHRHFDLFCLAVLRLVGGTYHAAAGVCLLRTFLLGEGEMWGFQYLIMFSLQCIFNGASFYIHVFSKIYRQKFEKFEKLRAAAQYVFKTVRVSAVRFTHFFNCVIFPRTASTQRRTARYPSRARRHCLRPIFMNRSRLSKLSLCGSQTY